MAIGFRRSHFTLIELMIVLTILSVIGGVLVINVNKALFDQRFRTEVSLVVEELRLAQDLMLILGTDVHLKVAEGNDSKEIIYWLEFDYPLPKQWEHVLKRKHKGLTAIHRVDFKDQLQHLETKGQFDIRFMSGGAVMSRGVMMLSTSQEDDPPPDALTRYICLPGYPSPLLPVVDKPDDSACTKTMGKDKDFDDQLTIYTREEIAAHQPAQDKTQETPQEKPKDEKKP